MTQHLVQRQVDMYPQRYFRWCFPGLSPAPAEGSRQADIGLFRSEREREL